jgi:cytoskeleton protein RodZ
VRGVVSGANSANRTYSVGSFLRENREARGIALDEAVRVTRIGKNYLTALEADRYDALPNTAYVTGFLRAYAAFLGLSGDEIVSMYKSSLPLASRLPAEENSESRVLEVRKIKDSRRSRWFVPITLMVFVIAAAYIFDEKGPKPEKLPNPSLILPTKPGTAPALPAPPVQPILTVPSAESPAKGNGDLQSVSTDLHNEGIVLKLKVNQDSWLNITIDGAVSQQYELKAGDLIEWKGDKVFVLDLGNAGGIEAEFNGKPLKPFGESGKPLHMVLKAGD